MSVEISGEIKLQAANQQFSGGLIGVKSRINKERIGVRPHAFSPGLTVFWWNNSRFRTLKAMLRYRSYSDVHPGDGMLQLQKGGGSGASAKLLPENDQDIHNRTSYCYCYCQIRTCVNPIALNREQPTANSNQKYC